MEDPDGEVSHQNVHGPYGQLIFETSLFFTDEDNLAELIDQVRPGVRPPDRPSNVGEALVTRNLR